jgi:cytoskeletal protein RodZ
MAGFGAALKAEREGRGLSLDVLSARTKVNLRHLAALEQEDFKALPGGVFRKGIVRAYLSAVGLNEELWMPQFQASYAAVAGVDDGAGQDAWVAFATNVKRARGSHRESTRLRWLGVVVLFALLAAAAWMVRDAVAPQWLHRGGDEHTRVTGTPHLLR